MSEPLHAQMSYPWAQTARARFALPRMVLVFIAVSCTMAACRTQTSCPEAGDWVTSVPAIELFAWASNGQPIPVCWSDDALYTTPTSCDPSAGGFVALDSVIYRVYASNLGLLKYTPDQIFMDVRADLARPPYGSCPYGMEFSIIDDTRSTVKDDLAVNYWYAVCRVIDGVASGCSNEVTFEWVTPIQGKDAGLPPGTDASTDSGNDAALDAACMPGPSDGAC